MQLVQVEADGNARLELDGHRFVVRIGDLAPAGRAGAPPDPNWLRTPEMVCIDPGCGVTMQTWFPLLGTAHAQRIHAHSRAARDTTRRTAREKLLAAMAAVNAEVRAGGGIPALDPDRV